MTLYFEYPVKFPETGAITVHGQWHLTEPLLAVASFSQDKGGFVIVFDEHGFPLVDVNYPVHRSFQATALAWHPERRLLVSGWENGELKVWSGHFDAENRDFQAVVGPHKSPVTLLEFSEKGGRLVSCDSTGSVVGWKVDNKGQITTAFHVDLQENLTHLTFRLTVKAHPDYDVEGLAKAAVNGDEHALDMFSNWRPKTTARKFRVSDGSDNYAFFIGTQSGSVFYVNASGSCVEVLNTEGVPLNYVVYHPIKDSLVVMMEGLTIGHFSVDHQGHLNELAKVKLSGRLQNRTIGSQGLIWCSNSALAVLTGELSVRIWDIESNDNYMLPTTFKQYSKDDNSHVNEVFTCIAYSKLNQTLCAGTNIGRIYFWSRVLNETSENPEDCWQLNNVNSISGTIKQLMWGSILLRQPVLSVNCVTAVYLMREQSISVSCDEKLWAIQKNAKDILLESAKGQYLLSVEEQVTSIANNSKYLAVSNGQIVNIYEITWFSADKTENKSQDEDCDFSVKKISSFSCDNEGILIFHSALIALTLKSVSIRSVLNGNVLNTINVPMNEGEPIGIDLTKNYLTIFTMEGFLRIYELEDNLANINLHSRARNLYDLINDFGEIIQAKTNADGTKVALTVAGNNLIPDGKLYVLDLDSEDLQIFDFKNSFANLPDEVADNLPEFYEICSNRIPLNLNWDADDPRLLVCDAKKLKMAGGDRKKGSWPKNPKDESKSLKNEDHILVTMFISSDFGIKIHDIKSIDADARLLSVSSPHTFLLDNLSIKRDLMSDFNGLEDCDKLTKEAVLDFSYHLTLGNMDAAFKSIKLVQSSGVWASLARMCVKTRRLDVAGVCLGHMGDAKAARALRIANTDANLPLEAKVAVLAIHLGMLDEAEQLYNQCERYDLLNKLLQCRNKIDEAHNIAETKDRIHLRNTEHAHAQFLEQSGNYKEAINHYEKANTHRYDVPRMLSDDPVQLQAYMSKTKDKELLKWWGQYIESQGDMQMALKVYASANDVYSQVRVLCFLGEETKAAELARSNNDKAAFYHMARFYETVANYEEAVAFFTKASAYSNAVRLCKENHMAEELWNLGFVVNQREKMECAKYFEDNGDLGKAVVLYHRAGMLHKAIDLAFKTEKFDILQQIAADLDAESDPALVEKCAQFFVSNEQFDKAVDLLAIVKKYKEAISLCLQHNVQLDEDLAEKLTPEKENMDEPTRIKILENLAESLMVQGNYHLATKKFTQAGDKVRAMKALLKSGDTDKIIFFAGVSRQREIYILAANYLQSLDWQNQPEILRNIITFYSKGKALDLLANFYVACAQVEIDEFQNYDKAYGALTEAARCLNKIQSPKDLNQHQRAVEIVEQRISLVKKFIDVKRLFERGDFQAGMTQCKQLLMVGGKESEAAVRKGDIYALMISNCIRVKDFKEAKELVNDLKQHLSSHGNIHISYYLSKDVIEALAQGLGVSVATIVPPTHRRSIQEEGDTVEEQLEG